MEWNKKLVGFYQNLVFPNVLISIPNFCTMPDKILEVLADSPLLKFMIKAYFDIVLRFLTFMIKAYFDIVLRLGKISFQHQYKLISACRLPTLVFTLGLAI